MKILIADKHVLVREGVKHVLNNMNNIYNIDESSEGNDTYNKMSTTNYDMVILEISMPGMNGLDILQKLKNKKIKSRVLVFSLHPQEQYATQSIKLGASGYLSKDCSCEELNNAIHKISEGEKFWPLENELPLPNINGIPSLLEKVLTTRELQIMLLMAYGKSKKEIADKIVISEKTVSNSRYKIFKKIGVKSQSDLILYAMRNKLIKLHN